MEWFSYCNRQWEFYKLLFQLRKKKFSGAQYTLSQCYSRAANLSLSKKVLLSLKKHIFRLKKSIFAREARIGRGPGPLMGPGSSQVLGALWCNLSLIFEIFIQKLWPIFHNINNRCNFQNFPSPVTKKKKKKKNNENVFLQEKTYMRILHKKRY